jgi:flagellar biosynthesis protein FlhA
MMTEAGVLPMLEKLKSFSQHRGTIMTLLIIALPIVLIQPMPSGVIDVLLSINITLAVLVILTCMYIDKPLHFSAFPSLLLILTLFRLVLNVASTRLILSEGYAGEVIGAFAETAAGGNLVIGFVIFLILVIIQFVVITKGATRIAEVSARFTLDAMPGKQMAIDADLNSGLIDEAMARKRREDISQEAEFYGAMDGASKFVRGDAIAGIIITGINIIGGIISGMVLLGQDLVTALETFVKLSIGDGLVSQIPAFIIAIASGLLVTRTSKQDSLGDELVKQLFREHKPIVMSSVFLVGLAFTGLPALPLLTLGGRLFLVGRSLGKTKARENVEARELEKQKSQETSVPKPERFLELDAMALEIGYGLIDLCDASKGGDIVGRIRMIRQQMAAELGFIVPSIRIHDNMQLEANEYVLKIRSVEVARGQCHAKSYLAMDTGLASGDLEGIETTEPAFGMKAVWISAVHKERAENQGYQVVDATSVLVTHLIEILRTHCFELVTRQSVANLVENLRQTAPRVVEDTIDAKFITMGDVQRVLQLLLRERVSVRDLETILEVMGDNAPKLKGADNSLDLEILTEYVRVPLGRPITHGYLADDGILHVVMLEPQLEDYLLAGLKRSVTRKTIEIHEPARSQIFTAILDDIEKCVVLGYAPVLLVAPSIRRQIFDLLVRRLPSIVVLSTVEIPSDIELKSESVVKIPAQLLQRA